MVFFGKGATRLGLKPENNTCTLVPLGIRIFVFKEEL